MRSLRSIPAPLALAALVATAPLAPEARAADAARGAQLYELCTQCHGADGGGNPAALAPSIAGLSDWYVAAQLKNFHAGLRGLDPNDVGGLRMYPMSLTLKSEAEIADVAAHVASLSPVPQPVTVTGGDPAKGASYYNTCAACHGPDGAGNQALNAPRLTGQSDWYLVSSLQKYKAGIRGGNPQNTNSVLMRGMSAVLPDEQAIKDVVAYIDSLDRQRAAGDAN